MTAQYKELYTFGMDFGTSHYKYGPITCGETPRIMENRGYFPDKNSLVMKSFHVAEDVIVGEQVPVHLQAGEDLSSRLVYPMRNGVVGKGHEAAWRVISEIAKYALESFNPKDRNHFEGFNVVASLSSVSPRYMYEKLFEIFRCLNGQQSIVKAATIIPQPLAVAIGHGSTTCVVIESGHGNTQICPISSYPIRNAMVAINRGGAEANGITAEILKDLGYGDLANEETLVRRVKEAIGLIPVDLDDAVAEARRSPRKFDLKFKIPGTRIVLEFEDHSWMRFLIGEYPFDPNHELYLSYFNRGMSKPADIRTGDTYFHGMMDLGEAIATSVERCPTELQPHLYRQILLSGGNFNWIVPPKIENVATDAPSKIRLLLKKKGIRNVHIRSAKNPQHSVWHGCIIYGYAVPDDYSWSWERLEGWVNLANGTKNS